MFNAIAKFCTRRSVSMIDVYRTQMGLNEANQVFLVLIYDYFTFRSQIAIANDEYLGQ